MSEHEETHEDGDLYSRASSFPAFGPNPDFSNVMGTDMPDSGLTPL